MNVKFLVFAFTAAILTAQPEQQHSYGPITAQTKYGKIVFRNIQLWNSHVYNDQPTLVTQISADVVNSTGSSWSGNILLSFKCLESPSAVDFKFAVEISEMARTRLDTKGLYGLDYCDPPEIELEFVPTASGRDRQEAAAQRQKYLAQFTTIGSAGETIFVGADRKCSEQFVQALSMEGLEKRKRLAELISYQCGFTEKGGLHAEKSETSGGYCAVKFVEGEHANAGGWVPCVWVK